ncbi:hypothetical protein Cgig2_024634 [Carnegiea gigantea]|uniref:Uncharacterized protein n=1 Tax=Carnegiea gigantea TaxID=171969 RepID=A0A9Q1K7Y6_9CARY|nr:hypothetical protein Cgig2_024634 [Carnegiea gigantea]
MATMGGVRYGWWEEERDKIVYEQKGWNNQHGGRRGGSGGGGGGAHDDGCVFDGSRWIRYYKGWCRVPAGDRSCVAENDKKKNDIGRDYYHHQALKKGKSNYTVLQPPPRTVQWKQYYDDHQEYEDVDSKALKKGTRNCTVLQPPPRTLKNKKKSKKNNRPKQPPPVRPLNERENYFSYVLSPWKKKNKKMNNNNNNNNNNNGNDLHRECPEGDVDCRAEVFIQEKHRKLKLGKMMSNLW